MPIVPAPLFRDPLYDGAADPMIIRNEQNHLYYMLYTQRRVNQYVSGISYCYGSDIGVAESEDGAYWYYRGALDLNFEFGKNTFWAPEVIFNPAENRYHMYVSYLRGIHFDWKGKATLEHYISDDFFHWEHLGTLSFGSSRIIDPCLYLMDNGMWRMWYKDENLGSHICYADSADLRSWTPLGEAIDNAPHEGANVFRLHDRYFLIADAWRGLGAYSSNDLIHFTRQQHNLLLEGSGRADDGVFARHADVFVKDDRAFIVYFTHPDGLYRTSIQLAEIEERDGILFCDRNREIVLDWTEKC